MSATATLLANLDKLSASDRQFAHSLLSARNPTEKQMLWIQKLADRAMAPAPVATESLPLTGIMQRFDVARSRQVHNPKIRLWLESGEKIVLAVAGDRSRYTGSVMLTDGQPFGQNTYYGRISPTGEVFPAPAMRDDVLNLLREFAANPSKIGATIGRRMGACCFCSRTLTTNESLHVGYGPVCAENYGLDWGHTN